MKRVYYLIIGVSPIATQWLVLTYDTSTRGLLILAAMMLTQAAITMKAFDSNDEPALAKLIADAEAALRARLTSPPSTTPAP